MVREYVRKVKLIAEKIDKYTVYVFKDVDNNELIMCTMLPNWQSSTPKLDEVGYLKYQFVKAGDSYITPEGEKAYYRYTNSYFINFVNDLNILKNDEIIL